MEANLKSLYEQQLKVPQERLSMPFLLCPVGFVGAGKTTVVKPLANELSLLRISSDELRELFIEKGIGYSNEDLNEIIYPLIEKYLAAGYGIAIDANCSRVVDMLEAISKNIMHH